MVHFREQKATVFEKGTQPLAAVYNGWLVSSASLTTNIERSMQKIKLSALSSFLEQVANAQHEVEKRAKGNR